MPEITTNADTLKALVSDSINDVKADFQNQVEKLKSDFEMKLADVKIEQTKSVIEVKSGETYPLGAYALAVKNLPPNADAKTVIESVKNKSVRSESENHFLRIAEKALSIGNISTGGGLFETSELVPLLRAASVVKTTGVPMVQFIGSQYKLSTMTAGSTAYWIPDDVSAITSSQPTFGMITLNAHKLAARVPISNDMIRQGVSIEQTVQNDLIASLGVKFDVGALVGTGGDGSIIGFANMTGINTNAMTSSPTVAKAVKDLAKAIKEIRVDNAPTDSLVWIMHPAISGAIRWFTTSTGEYHALAIELQTRNTIMGIPVYETANQTQTVITLYNASSQIIGESYSLNIEADPYSGHGNDLTYIRAVYGVDLGTKYAQSICTITGVDWDTSI